MSYCTAIHSMTEPRKSIHKNYHDHLYGFPLENDNELFGRLILEINQAGLSWETILKKEIAFREAYMNYNIEKVANFTESEISILLNNPGIIRNKLKINAAIHNAKRILELQKEFGSFQNWLDQHHPKSKDEWVRVFKKEFKFTGGEIVNEFLMSTGYLSGAHDSDCPIHHQIIKQNPKWLENQSS